MRAMAIGVMLVLATGCAKTDPADDIGRFAVTQARTEHCGDGTLLAAPEERNVVVYLREVSAGVLHWQQGEDLMVLTYNPQNGEFTSGAGRLVDMRNGDTSQPTCIIERNDILSGILTRETLEDPATIEGELRYDFVPTANSNCEDLLTGQTPIADEMPCAIAYEFIGEAI